MCCCHEQHGPDVRGRCCQSCCRSACGWGLARDILHLVTAWKELLAVFVAVGQHRWWRLSLVTVFPAYVLAGLIPAFHGWPEDVTTVAWSLVVVALFVDLVRTGRRLSVTDRSR